MASETNTDQPDAPPSSDASTPSQPTTRTLGKYILTEKIGEGGMGRVFLGSHAETGQEVALKVLSKANASNEMLVKRFQAEAEAAKNLKHENIVAIYDAGEADGHLYIALEYLKGTDVYKLIKARKLLPVKRTIQIVFQVASALQHAFERGIVHRDIKPSNLLISRDGTVKLTDLGLARAIDEEVETDLTRAGTTVGTVDYMAPEQARSSKSADTRSDIYSLGCTWYHMLTGEVPFAEGSMTNKLFAHASKKRPDPRKLNDQIPEELVIVLHKMMARKPADRYPTPNHLLTDLKLLEVSPESLLPSEYEMQAFQEEDLRREKERTARKTSSPPPSGQPKKKKPGSSSQLKSGTKSKSKNKSKSSLAAVTGSEEEGAPPQVSKELPPPGKQLKRKQPKEKKDAKVSFSPKPLLIGAGVLTVAVALWFMVKGFSSAFDSDGGSSGNPFNEEEVTQNPTKKPVRPLEEKNPPDEGEQPKDPEIHTELFKPVLRTQPADWAKLPFGRDGERGWIPLWVKDVWPDGNSKNLPLAVVTVGRSGNGPSADFATLSQAIAKAPKEGVLIQLQGTGPFFLAPQQLNSLSHLAIAGPGGTPAVVSLLPNTASVPRVFCRLTQGSLTLSNLHLVMQSDLFPKTGQTTLFEVVDGDLTVRNCSLTVEGGREGTTTAFALSDVKGSKNEILTKREPYARPHVLIHKCFLRGENLNALQINATTVDAVLADTLMVSSYAPLVDLTHTHPPDKTESKEPERILSFLSTSATSRESFMKLSVGERSLAPPRTMIHTVNSVVGAPRDSRSSKMMLLEDWPGLPNTSSGVRVQNVLWRTEATLFSGWSNLVKTSQSETELSTSSARAWEQLWDSRVQSHQFRLSPWPESPLGLLDRVSPATLGPDSITNSNVPATDAGSPGIVDAPTGMPTPDQLQRAETLAFRARLHKVAFGAPSIAGGHRIRLDITQDDLGRVISGSTWPSGTEFIAMAQGLCYSSPIYVKDKNFKITFEQTSGRPYVLMPANINSTADPSRGNAFITVENGTIEIENGNIRIPPSKRTGIPKWVLHVTNGQFRLDGTFLQGPLLDSTAGKGLIHWTTTEAHSVKITPQTSISRIENSFLVGLGELIKARMNHQTLVVHQSVLAGLEHVFDLEIADRTVSYPGVVLLHQSTVSAATNVFQLHSDAFRKPDFPMLQFYVDETVFAAGVPSLESIAVKPVLIEHTADTKAGTDFDWWENSTGYTATLAGFFKEPKKTATGTNFDENWRTVWGPNQIQRALSESGDVLMAATFPKHLKLTPADFALHGTAAAMTWSPTGGKIGANVLSIRLPEPKPEEKPKVQTTPPVKKPNLNGKPDF